MGYTDPIWPTIEGTHAAYSRQVRRIAAHLGRANLMVASHNKDSVAQAVALVEGARTDGADGAVPVERDVARERVFFGQLLGMGDHLSMTLGAHGFNAYKYVPYGPIQAVIPYLVRRAEENSALLVGGVGVEETGMLRAELWRRVRSAVGMSQ